ncbi:MAG: hypothetical protein K0R36_1773 [Chryseobacterium sp.]|nr:hypothetical protein [Chryseobacterium sp.]
MMGKKNAREHDIHNRSMIGDDNVLRVSINFFFGKIDKLISHSHSVENAVAPDPDKNIGIFIGFLVKRK